VHLGREISTHYFSFLGGPGVVSLKSTPGHVTPNLCVLHPSCGICESCSAFSGVWSAKPQCTIFMQGWDIMWLPQKACCDSLRRTCVFPSGGICGSHSGFQCVWGAKPRCTFFMLMWDKYIFHKKHTGTRYYELVFLHPV
jgi:hypothetical protein